ncbi:helix-turn-helix domain-containing protein [Metabacillus halosaccharovorans]|uniref:helix-turn-helix domain-containing protein n=1 Tax=Metabacillus halosaccharovorans TaxID=930124 RepID=UPI00203CA9F3|nr:helix-turn-helix domain-containing protein [Metabacillus halosaccharovorans]MCM3440293.1 helix-turn-helix domain-containing protein [Metabacillus halosaccharovorans]
MADIDLPSDYVAYPESHVLIAGHFHVKDTYQTKRQAGMNDWLITFTLDGEGYFKTGDEHIICTQGDVTILRPTVPHQYGTSRGKTWHFFWAHFSPELFETNYLSDKRLVNLTIENEYIRNRINQSFEKLIQDYRERQRYWYELCELSLKEILLLIAQRQVQALDSRIEEVLHILSKQMKDSISIKELAKSVNLSPSRLSHLFKENVGHSILDTLKQMRLNQAALLLEHTDRSASEIAYEVGYQNYNYFAIHFRKRYGVSPRQYTEHSIDINKKSSK